MTINVYSKAKDGNKKLSKNFKVKEFACSDGSDPVFIDSNLIDVLQNIRDHFGKPVVITSGFRTANHNKSVNGSVYSQHLYGKAVDIKVKDVKPITVAKYVETLLTNTGGIGLYKTFVHVDVRTTKARWQG